MSSLVSSVFTRLACPCSQVLLCAVLLSGAGVARGDSEGSNIRTSIWEREIPGTNRSYAEVSRGEATEQLAEPAQLPLPAPVLAAGLGLVGAYVVKRRLSRS